MPSRSGSGTLPVVPFKICNPRTKFARRSLQERTDKQAESKEQLSIPQYQPGDQVFVHRPCTVADGPNHKRIRPRRDPFSVRSQLSPVFIVLQETATLRKRLLI